MKLGRPRDHRRDPAAKNPDLRSRYSPCFYFSSEKGSDPDGHALVSQTCSPLRIQPLSLQEGSSRKLWLLAKSRVSRVWDNLFDLLLYVIICLLLGWWRHTCSLFCIFSFLLYLGKTLCESPQVNSRLTHIDTLLLLSQESFCLLSHRSLGFSTHLSTSWDFFFCYGQDRFSRSSSAP